MKLVIVLMGWALLAACGPAYHADPVEICQDGETRCAYTRFERCDRNTWLAVENCTGTRAMCDAAVGCVACPPGQVFCADSATVQACDANGDLGQIVEQCDNSVGDFCEDDRCGNPCARAAQGDSYVGCDYWATPTSNVLLAIEFDYNFGMVVHNANRFAATVTLSRGGVSVMERAVEPGEAFSFQQPLDLGLKGILYQVVESAKVVDAAYHLVSTLPVTVYQFNPLDFGETMIHSYTNDASLLLPAHALSGDYLVMARQTLGFSLNSPLSYDFLPGFVAITGTADGTTVTVTSRAYTMAENIANGFGAMSPGQSQTFTLDRGEVLQLISKNDLPTDTCDGLVVQNDCGRPELCHFCDMQAAYDLTGSRIQASAPVAVYSGHDCSFVPFDIFACDHLEEQMIPMETWGKTFVVARTEPQNDVGFPIEPNVVRLLSGADANTITLRPPQSIGSSVTLNQGEWREFEAEADFEVDATGALMIGQFTVGQSLYTDDLSYHGDPAFAIVVPVDQFRKQYGFLAPSTFPINFVNVVKRVDLKTPAAVFLDGIEIPAFEFSAAIGGSPYGVARLAISATGHTIESADSFGISVYGFAPYTSYMYPGGLDLAFINPIQ